MKFFGLRSRCLRNFYKPSIISSVTNFVLVLWVAQSIPLKITTDVTSAKTMNTNGRTARQRNLHVLTARVTITPANALATWFNAVIAWGAISLKVLLLGIRLAPWNVQYSLNTWNRPQKRETHILLEISFTACSTQFSSLLYMELSVGSPKVALHFAVVLS